jgi:hypothetical protein
MALQNRELARVWALRLSLVTMMIVVILSWINAVKLLDLLVRAGVSFGVMFLLLVGSLILFEQTGILPSSEELTDTVSERGGLVDFSIGDDETLVSQTSDSAFPGQVDPSLGDGILDGKQQAEIVRRMGWN